MGSSLTQFVLVWWITQKTGSPTALATAGIMAMLPAALFSPLGGVIADRLSRRMIMIIADAITAVCMLILVGLFATDSIQLWHLYTLMFVRATMQAFQQPASAASTMNLVPQDWLDRARWYEPDAPGSDDHCFSATGRISVSGFSDPGSVND